MTKPTFSLRLSLPFIFAFITLRHLFHEMHEFMHMLLGRCLCGVWGTRDFNNVNPISTACAQQISKLVGLEGPLLNYISIWIAAIIIRTATETRQLSCGIVLIFVNLPMARFFTALMGGGDELGVAKHFIQNPLFARLTVCLLIFSILIYPLTLVYQRLKISYRLYVFLGFLFLPMVWEGLVILGFLNHLLKTGIMNEILFFGTPKLTWIVLLADIIILAPFIKNISKLLSPVKDDRITFEIN